VGLRTWERVRGKRGSVRPRQGHASHAEGRDAARRGPRPRQGAAPREQGGGGHAPRVGEGRGPRAAGRGGAGPRAPREQGSGAAPPASREGRGARVQEKERARAGGEEEGEGERERRREERGGELTSGSNSGDHRLQNLGHHGEREVEEGEGGCCVGNPNERERDERRGRMGWCGR
jgi:hypothetical protein